jgi:lysophospholipase L1-like esterase
MDETSDSLLWKKKYSAMSRAMERCCNELNSRLNNNSNKVRSKQIRFVDCLTMFCGESAEQPGAVFGGRAKAEHQYFASDGLHLNDEGYQVWKDRIEHIIYDYFLLVQRQCCGK